MASPVPNVPHRTSVVPSEVGWQFVSQYYTFVNKQPHRLHCFYTKNSTYIHGVEGEDSSACHGQQEIHNKILSIGFQDCKVFIHSVDAQSSSSAGIVIQVIGEMSNAGEAWRKFAQTFFLAEQPNGYFVLNDIFRYLKEESSGDDADDDEVKEEAEVHEEEAVPEPAATQLHDVPEHPPAQPEPEPVVSLPPPAPQETVAPEPAPEAPAVNGTHVEEKTPEPKETTQLPSPSPEPEVEPVEEPTPEELTPARGSTPAPAPAAVSAPAPVPPAATPAPPPAEKPQPSAPPAQPAQPAAPSAPKTWANLAATNSSKWGQVSADARGISTSAATAAAAKPATPTPKPVPAAAPRKEEPPVDTSNLTPQAQAAMAVNTPQCFIKLNDWVRDNGPGNQAPTSAESVSPTALKEVLTTRFGAIKELEVVRTKACAFLEFVTIESARRAILASLPVAQGGEGGIRIGEDTPNERAPRITVEMRKERADRPMTGGRPRTGGQEPRGSFRGRGSRGRGGESRPGVPQAAK